MAWTQRGVLVGSGGGGTAAPQVNLYSTAGSFTWTKPSGAKFVEVICIAGGGGGGSGRRGAASTLRYGGNGGVGGGVSWAATPGTNPFIFRAAQLPASVAVTVGAGGTGGAVVSTNDTDGTAGGAGGASLFGTGPSS